MRERCKKESMWAFVWIRMFKALIGKLTKFRKRRIENVMSVDLSILTVEEELAWDGSIPYLLNLEIRTRFPEQSGVDHCLRKGLSDEGEHRASGGPAWFLPVAAHLKVEMMVLERLVLGLLLAWRTTGASKPLHSGGCRERVLGV